MNVCNGSGNHSQAGSLSVAGLLPKKLALWICQHIELAVGSLARSLLFRIKVFSLPSSLLRSNGATFFIHRYESMWKHSLVFIKERCIYAGLSFSTKRSECDLRLMYSFLMFQFLVKVRCIPWMATILFSLHQNHFMAFFRHFWCDRPVRSTTPMFCLAAPKFQLMPPRQCFTVANGRASSLQSKIELTFEFGDIENFQVKLPRFFFKFRNSLKAFITFIGLKSKNL